VSENEVRLIDTHCHLVSDRMKEFVGELVENARQVGVQKVMNIAYNPATVDLALEQSRNHRGIYCTLGIQPHDAHHYSEAEVARILNLAKQEPQVVAIGEIGLDAFHKLAPMDLQVSCFEHFLEVALELDLPVVVHVRETFFEVHSRLKSFAQRGGKGVIHCFTCSQQEGVAFLDLGFYLSFSGILTFKNSVDLQEAAKFFPENKLLIETDSPYLAPIPHRGKRNEPAWVKETCKFLAELRCKSFEEMADLTWRNAHELFRKLEPSEKFLGRQIHD
jgi:TatD DNase family protein